jgi:hypothetical protein
MRCQESANRGPANSDLFGNLPLGYTLTEEFLHFLPMPSGGDRSAVRFSFLAGLRNTSFHSVAQNVAFELSKDGQHSGQSAPTGGSQVEGFTQGNESYLERGQFL